MAEAPYAFGSKLADWQGAAEERWRDRLRLPGARDLVAYLGDEAVGMATGVPTDPYTVEIISVWVSPAGRGRGVGDALVAAIVAWAAESGATSLRLAVRRDNAPARRLYERAGFRDAGPNEEDPDEILMQRNLPGAA
ncbi:GNAT family N-acetyltransferase [Asanoa sp. NPDC049518]|uniref:GNAT family N-acetyltransferase n=1 Tax=Asanoa sp. NPDC049518 TaxID=3155503 RepID=UPI00343E4AEA